MTQPTLMYGIGATKAGTGWLYRYLDTHPDCAMSDPKELHYFDTLEFGPRQRQIKSLRARVDRIKLRMENAKGSEAEELKNRHADLSEWLEVLMQNDPDRQRYISYLNRNAGSAKLVGEITPSYALLPEERLREMAGLAPVTRFVYLLREPVARLWSNIRMMAKLRARSPGEVATIASRIAQRYLRGDEKNAAARSDYTGALNRLFSAVPEKSLFVEFYETLFCDEAMNKLCQFLGIAPRMGNYDNSVHGGVPVMLDDDTRFALAQRLAPQYAAVEARFGTLPEAWRKNMVKV